MNQIIAGLVSISMVNIVLATLAWGTFAFVLWRLARKWGDMQNSFDISIVGILMTLMIHRVLYIIFYLQKFSTAYWSLYPYLWKQGTRIIFGTKPWIVLAFWRGGFDYRIILFAGIVTLFVISVLMRQRFLEVLEVVISAVIFSFPIVLIMSWVNSFYFGVDFYDLITVPYLGWTITKHPIYVYQLGIFFIIAIARSWVFRKFPKLDRGKVFVLGALLFFCNAVILYYYGYGISKDLIGWLVGLGSVMGILALWKISFGGEIIEQSDVEIRPFRRRFLNVTQRSYRRFG